MQGFDSCPKRGWMLTIELTIYGSQKGYPEHPRLVRFFDEEQGREFMFLTNAMELTALQVADLYKNRWQIELFFKWLKQATSINMFPLCSRPLFWTKSYMMQLRFAE